MNDQAATLLDRADDRVAGNRLATAGQLDGHALGSVNGERHVARRIGGHVLARQQATGNDRRQTLAETDVGIQLFDRLLAAGLDQLIPGIGRDRDRHHSQGQQFLAQQAFAEASRLFILHGAQEMPYLAARAPRLDVIEPHRVRAGLRRGDDFDHVAIAQLGAQRYQILVDACRRAMVADIGMHVVGKIDDGRAARHSHDLALGREHIDLVREEVDLDVLEELGGIAALHFKQRLQPLVRLDLEIGTALLGILVQPVGCNALLGDVMHLGGAYLYLDRRTVRADQRRVQRLVAVGLGNRDVVLELAGHWLV